MPKRHPLFFITLAFLLLLPLRAAQAHRVSVFAWVEGDTAHVEGRFAGGKPVQGGTVTVKGPGGEVLLTGKTDETGTFSFQIPQPSELKVVVSAGMGHQGDWTIKAEEIAEVSPDPGEGKAETAPAGPVEKAADPAPLSTAPPADGTRTAGLSPEVLQAAVERALDKKLKPVIRMLTDARQGPGITEVLGGIGYIIGLVGVAAYVSARRQRTSGETPR